MVRLKPTQRRMLVDKIPDLANIGAGLFVFAQFIGEGPSSLSLLLIGLAIWAAVLAGMTAIAGGEE